MSPEHIHLFPSPSKKTPSISTEIPIQTRQLLIEQTVSEVPEYEHAANSLPTLDLNTLGHAFRTEQLAMVAALLLTTQNGVLYHAADMQHIRYGMRYHDAGKGFPQIQKYILSPQYLTDDERVITHQHPWEGYCMLRAAGLPDQITFFARSHHQNCSNTGYPSNVQFNDFPWYFSALLRHMINGSMVIDVFDALRSNRHYRKRHPIYGQRCSPETTMDELTGHKYGTIFYAPMVNVIRNNFALFYELQDRLHSAHAEVEHTTLKNQMCILPDNHQTADGKTTISFSSVHYNRPQALRRATRETTEAFLNENIDYIIWPSAAKPRKISA